MKLGRATKTYDSGLFVLGFVWMTVAVATLGFMLGVPVLAAHPVIAFLLCVLAYYYLSGRDFTATLQVSLASLAVIAFCIAVSAFVFDMSWDGNAYHKSMVGLMKEGWNPLFSQFQTAVETTRAVPDLKNYASWYDAYTKGTEVFGACIYALTGHIDAGKCYTMLSCFSVVTIGGVLLHDCLGLKRWQALLVGLCLTFNPVTLPQAQSYYNDAFLGMLIFLTVASLVYLTRRPDGAYARRSWIVLFLTINLAVNVKMSGIIHMAAYCFPFFIYWTVRAVCRAGWRESRPRVLRQVGFYAGTLASGLCFTGSTGYVKNFITYRNPFYTMIGEGSVEIVDSMLASAYESMSHIERFVRSTFSAVNNTIYDGGEQPRLKIPFTVSADEFGYVGYDIRVSGWGIFFSGILIISVIILAVALRGMVRRRSDKVPLCLLLLGCTFVPVFFVPALCWARYFMQYFLIPAAALIFLFHWMNRGARRWLHGGLGVALSLVLLLNCAPMVITCGERVYVSQITRMNLTGLSQLTETEDVEISLMKSEGLQGFLFNLKDYGIEDYTLTEGWRDDYTSMFQDHVGYRVLEPEE